MTVWLVLIGQKHSMITGTEGGRVSGRGAHVMNMTGLAARSVSCGLVCSRCRPTSERRDCEWQPGADCSERKVDAVLTSRRQTTGGWMGMGSRFKSQFSNYEESVRSAHGTISVIVGE